MRFSQNGSIAIIFGNIVLDKRHFTSNNGRQGFFPLINGGDLSDKLLLVSLLVNTVPFEIIFDGDAKFFAELKRFPYHVNGNLFHSFGLRLVPVNGKVSSVTYKKQRLVCLDKIEYGTDFLFADLGNGSLHFELFFKPTDSVHELSPPEDFRKKIYNACTKDGL